MDDIHATEHQAAAADASAPDDTTHGREGSAPACQILLLLHRHRPLGLSRSDLSVFTGLPSDVIGQALIGLQSRRRAVCMGRGTAARYVLQQDAGRAAAAQG